MRGQLESSVCAVHPCALSCFCSPSPWTTVGPVSPLASGLSLTKEGGTAHQVQRLGCRKYLRHQKVNAVKRNREMRCTFCFSIEQAVFALIVTAHLCVFMRWVAFWTLHICFSKDYGTATLWMFNLDLKPSETKWKPHSFEIIYFITGYGSSILVCVVIFTK